MAEDITCIVNFHNEAILAHRTLKSVQRASQKAEGRGLTVRILGVLDRATAQTRATIERFWPDLQLLATDFGEPALARNAAVDHTHGQYVAFVDGDDLICENWLAAAWEMNQQNTCYVLHPDLNVYFGGCGRLMQHPNQPPGTFQNGTIAFENFWTALCFAKREIFKAVPYVSNAAQFGFGFEDWQFNCETIAAGYRHRTVPRTAHFIRVKEVGGMSQRHASQGAILRHNALFTQMASGMAKSFSNTN